MFGLDTQTLFNITECFKKNTSIEKVLLYGSRAKGNYRNGSDIDMTLIGKHLTLSNSVYPLMDELDNLYIPYGFDISILSQINNQNLIKHILSVGKTLYEKEKGLPDNWEVKKLGEVCEKTSNIKWQNNSHKIFQYIDLSTVSRMSLSITIPTQINAKNAPNRAKKIIKTNDIIFATTRPTLKRIASIESQFDNQICSTGFVVLRVVSNLMKHEFIFYFLQTSFFMEKMESMQRGASYPAVTDNNVKSVKIPTPPLAEQKQIVAKLDQCFAAIDKAHANAAKNFANAKQLFQSKLNQIFTQKGSGWADKKLGDVCQYDKNKNQYNNLPYAGLEHIESNSGKFIGSLEPHQVKSSTFHFNSEHILYGRLRPYLNKVLIPNFEGHCSTEIFPILVGDEVIRGYLFYWLISDKTVKKIDATCTGTRMPRANMNEVINFILPIPPLAEQKQIVTTLDALSQQTKTLEQNYQNQLKSLEELKKSLLKKAFEGKLVQ